jgi:hypothetical protein
MADILLSNEDLTVFGGPESISLDLDIGPQGDRGSIIVGANGNPQDANVHAELLNIPDGIEALDIAIDYNPYSPTYKTVFQRVATATGTQWTEMFSLKTNFYSSVKTVTAVANGPYGIITIPPINVTEIYDISVGEVTSENFSVQYSISSPDSAGPVSTTLAVKDLVTTQGFLALPLEIKGVEYDGTTWVPMTGPKTVHLFITVV